MRKDTLVRASCALAGAVSALFLAGCGGGSDAASTDENGLTPLVMQTDWYAQPEHGGFYQAVAEGLYEKEGVSVTITPGGPNAFVPQKVAKGSADFGMGRFDDLCVRIDKGIPLIIVAALMQHDPQGLMLHTSNPINTLEEMDGQRVMIGPGSVMVKMMEEIYNLSIKVQPLDFGIGRFMADPEFIQQCFVTSEPYFVRKKGGDPKVILISEMGYDPYRLIFCRRELVEEQPEAVRAFVKATIEGWRQYIDPATDRTAANNMIITDNETMDDPEFMAYTIDAMQKYKLIAGDPAAGDAIGILRKSRMDEGVDMLRRVGLIENIESAADIYTTEFLPENLQAMLSEEEKVSLK